MGLSEDRINIKPFQYKPNPSNPRQIMVNGHITVKDQQRKLYEDALKLAQKTKKLSKQIADRINVKRTKITISSFSISISNDDFIDQNFAANTELLMEESRSLASANSQSTRSVIVEDAKLNLLSPQDEETPNTNLEENATMIVHEDDTAQTEEEYALISTPKQTLSSDDKDSFQMVDAI